MYPGGKAAGGEQQSWGEASLGLLCLVHWEPFPVGWAQWEGWGTAGAGRINADVTKWQAHGCPERAGGC